MSSDVYAVPDLSKKVRYTRKRGDGREEWAEREVSIYESADDVVDNRTNFQSQEGEPQTQKHPTVRRAGVVGAVMCSVLLAGIIILSIYTTLKISELKSHISQLQAQAMELNSSQLQSRYDILSKNHSQLMDEVKKLKSEIKGKWCPDGWTTFGASCYFKFTGRKTWTESRKDCLGRGADLVMINSKEEQEFISELGKNSWFWIGLKRTERGWEWWDGTSPTGTFWAHGEQHRYNGYNVVCCDDHGKWAVSYSAYTSNWICEKLICRF